LDEWIAFPKKMVRDTFMMYRQGDPEIRKAIIAYIESQKG
jgi:cytochrome c2